MYMYCIFGAYITKLHLAVLLQMGSLDLCVIYTAQATVNEGLLCTDHMQLMFLIHSSYLVSLRRNLPRHVRLPVAEWSP